MNEQRRNVTASPSFIPARRRHEIKCVTWDCVWPTGDLQEAWGAQDVREAKARLKHLSKGLLVHVCKCRSTIWEMVHEGCLQKWLKESNHIDRCAQCGVTFGSNTAEWHNRTGWYHPRGHSARGHHAGTTPDPWEEARHKGKPNLIRMPIPRHKGGFSSETLQRLDGVSFAHPSLDNW